MVAEHVHGTEEHDGHEEGDESVIPRVLVFFDYA